MYSLDELRQKSRMFYLSGAITNDPNYPSINRIMGLEKLILDTGIDKNSIVCEIGCFGGVSTCLFAHYARSVFGVDLWNDKNKIVDQYDEDMSLIKKAEALFDLAMTEYDNIVKIKKDSIQAATLFQSQTFDLVYIDAGHSYEDAYKDITAWYPLVKSGGYICGHDYWYSEVNRAVNDYFFYLCPDIKTYEDSSWCIEKPF